MTEPKASDLRFNKKKTLEVREKASQSKKIRVTIYLDEELVTKLKILNQFHQKQTKPKLEVWCASREAKNFASLAGAVGQV